MRIPRDGRRSALSAQGGPDTDITMRRVRPKTLILLTAAAFVAGATTCTVGALAAPTLSGAGSGLVAPLEVEWAQAFQAIYGITVNFTAVGSQTGIS